jgi:UTP-glucose-1-phosphate uridylyltransferase
MADGLKMLLAMALFFGAMYLYALAPDIIEKRKQKKLLKKTLQKQEERKEEVIQLQKQRDDNTKKIGDRRERIQQHYVWLQEMNEKIKRREQTQQENTL